MTGKRNFSDMAASCSQEPSSRFITVFEAFRDDLDSHHDRRERIIKASRDITAASKKIIFALQRVRTLGQPLPQGISKATKPLYEAIYTAFASVAADLQGINSHRYARNITGGIQEYMEAVSFQHYLETQTLITRDAAETMLRQSIPDAPAVTITHQDYILGLYDMTGELMRFAITTMATSGNVLSSSGPNSIDAGEAASQRTVLDDLREITFRLETIDSSGEEYSFKRDVSKKLSVSQASVEKVEKAVYGLVVRGSERPKGWMPDLTETSRGDEIDAY